MWRIVRFASHRMLILSALGLALCLREESLKVNRYRSIVDVSLKRGEDQGSVIDMQDPSLQRIFEHDLHANNYRDGVWGSIRHMVVKDGSG